MDFKIINTSDSFVELEEDWRVLEQHSPEITYFSTFEYCYSWWKIFKELNHFKIFVIAIYHNNRIAGIAPMLLKANKSRFQSYTTLEFMARGDYADFLIDCTLDIKPLNIIKQIFKIIEEYSQEWDEINLTHISQHTLLAQYLLKSNYNKYFTYLIENPYIDFAKFEKFDDYCKNFLPAKTIQYVNRLKRATDFRLEISDKNIINEISEIHIAEKNFLLRKGKKNRQSLFEDRRRKQFLSLLYENSNHILSYMLIDQKNGDKIIAYNTGFVFKNVFYSTNTAYDPEYERYGVGKIIYYFVFKQNFETKLWNVFDTLAGRYAWKFEWTNKFNLLYKFQYLKANNRKLLLQRKLGNITMTLVELKNFIMDKK